MNQRTILITASVIGFLSVTLGAFGAHGLESLLEANGRAETFELAVRYQFYHGLAMLAVGILIEKYPSMKTVALLFLIGIIIFSGSLYILALANKPILGAFTPFGGLALLGGWGWMVWSILRTK